MNTQAKVRSLVMNAVMTAVILIMSFVPFLGYIPLGFMNATIIHVPVIIGAILLGPKSGAWLGFVFGCTSLWKKYHSTKPDILCVFPIDRDSRRGEQRHYEHSWKSGSMFNSQNSDRNSIILCIRGIKKNV